MRARVVCQPLQLRPALQSLRVDGWARAAANTRPRARRQAETLRNDCPYFWTCKWIAGIHFAFYDANLVVKVSDWRLLHRYSLSFQSQIILHIPQPALIVS